MIAALLAAAASASAQSADAPAESELPAPPEESDEEAVEDAASAGFRMTPTEGVEEITITGEVLESSTQAEPEAITTFDQEELDTLGIVNVDSLALNTPSLHVGQVGQQAVITLRGIGLENLTSIGEAGVGFEIDGVHIGRPSGSNAAFFDLERVDVLRGPQGYKGGRNLTAGRIALHSKRPNEDLDASIDATFGNYRHFQTRAILNVPIWQEKLMTRASFLLDRRDGYQENLLHGNTGDNADDSQDLSLRVQARSLLLDQTVEARGIFYYGQQGGNGPAVRLLGPPAAPIQNGVQGALGSPEARARFVVAQAALPPCSDTANPVPGVNCDELSIDLQKPRYGGQGPNEPQYIRSACEPAHPDFEKFDAGVDLNDPLQNNQQWICKNSDPRKTYAESLNDRDNENIGFTGHLTWDVPYWADTVMSDVTLKLIGSYQNLIANSFTDFDATNVVDTLFQLDRESKQTQIEFYVERPDVDFFDFKAGVFYFKEDINTDVCFDANGTDSSLGDTGLNTQVTTESLAGYLTVGFRPIDNLRLFAGTRYIDEAKSADQIIEDYGGDGPTNFGPLATGRTRASQEGCPLSTYEVLRLAPPEVFVKNSEDVFFEDSYTAWTPAFGIEWQVTEDSSLGFNAVNGWKAGGFPLGVGPTLQFDPAPYESEEVWSYELTSKNELFNGLMRLNIAAFWTEYEPFQVCQFSGPIFFCSSDGGATIRGVEIEWNANPIEALAINGHFNYIDSRINNFQLIDPTEKDCLSVATADREACEAGTYPPRSAQKPLPTDVTGNSLSRSPAWAGSFGMQYTLDFGRWGLLTPRIQTQFQGKTFYRVFNREELSQDPFAKLDLKLMWRSENDRFKAEAFVYNLTEEDIINSMIIGPVTSGGQGLAQYQAPRVIGFQVGINYISDLVEDFF